MNEIQARDLVVLGASAGGVEALTDELFRSTADSYGPRVTGVVLTGARSPGSRAPSAAAPSGKAITCTVTCAPPRGEGRMIDGVILVVDGRPAET
jgi:chemotaxis response regulator CheB